MYKLYSIPGTCSTGITALLKKLGQEVEIINRDDVPDYQVRINPANQVPILDDNGVLIREGAAIALYLLEKHDSLIMRSRLAEKTEFLQWLMFNYATLHPAYGRMFVIAKTLENSESKEKLLQKLGDKLSDIWKILDERLEGRKFVVGNEATIVDYLATIYSSWGNFFPQLNITLGKNVERLVQDISVLPEFQAAYEAENNQFQAVA